MHKLIIILILGSFLFVSFSCKSQKNEQKKDYEKETNSQLTINKEALTKAEDAILAHKSFASTVSSETLTLATYVNYMNTTLAPDQKFLLIETNSLPVELQSPQEHLRKAREDWNEFFSSWTKKRDPKKFLSERLRLLKEDCKRKLEKLDQEKKLETSKLKLAEPNETKKLIIDLQISTKYKPMEDQLAENCFKEIQELETLITTENYSKFYDENPAKMLRYQESAKKHVEEAEAAIEAYKNRLNQ